MPKRESFHSIEEDTGIMPLLIAETIVERARELIDDFHVKGDKMMDPPLDDQELAGYLVGRAATFYEASTVFRKKIRSEADQGNRGRDNLFAYMQDWVSAKILRESHNSPEIRRALIDSGFAAGRW